ncbi:MAG TPA: cell division protein ZapB [Bryobacteraceae bacterium]|jgi:chromosome segregation ATPase
MEAVQEGIDTLASLEERITRAVQAISTLRNENSRLQEQLKAAQERADAASGELEHAQALSAEFQKENSALEQKISQLSQEVDTMKGERKQVKTRIEKLLNQLDLLSAS